MKGKGLNIRDLTAAIPVIQGGMGIGVSLSGLAGSVARHGGIGMISTANIGYNEPGFREDPLSTNLRALKKQIGLAKEIAGNGIFGINIMAVTNKYDQYIKTAVNAGIDLIVSGAGLPIRLPELVAKTKTKIAPIVSSIRSAATILKLWDRRYQKVPDLLVIEGPKAGGHLGFTYEQLQDLDGLNYDEEIKGIIALAEQYGKKYYYDIPVVVAGGIYQREDMEKQLLLGAAGVQLGTRFVTTKECDASEAYKNAYLNAKKEDIEIVMSPVGLPGRALRNDFIKKVESGRSVLRECYHCMERCDRKNIPYCITDALMEAVKGNVEQGLVFCGADAYRAERMENAGDILAEFCVEGNKGRMKEKQ